MLRTLRNVILLAAGIALVVRMLVRLSQAQDVRAARMADAAQQATAPVPPAEAPVEDPVPVAATVAPDAVAPDAVAPDAGVPTVVAAGEAEARALLEQLNAALGEPAASLTTEADTVTETVAPSEAPTAEAAEEPVGSDLDADAAPTEDVPADVDALDAEWVVPDAADADEDAATLRGSFTVCGTADGARQSVLAAVRFSRPAARAPHAWVLGGTSSPPGTIVLDVDATENCEPGTVGVVFVAGFAPTVDGFSVRVVCTAAGPFSVRGRFCLNEG